MRATASVIAAALGLVLGVVPTRADEAQIAVAANFTAPARELAGAFEARSGHRLRLSFGSTGLLFTQITQEAPFQVFLAADRERPAEIVARGLAADGAVPITYARGRLVLYSRDPKRVRGESTLRAGSFERLAVANPETAPYGSASIALLRALGVEAQLEPKLVRGNDIAQTYQFVFGESAELGLVALSQVIAEPNGSRWLPPSDLYPALWQDAVLLRPGAESSAARGFMEFLEREEARSIIERYGYGLEE